MSINKFGMRNHLETDSKASVDQFIKSTGDTMLGTLNMNKNKIVNLAEPQEASDAATKLFVYRSEQKLRAALDKIITKDDAGNLVMNDKQIKGLALPTDPLDAVNKVYLDRHCEFIPAEYTLDVPESVKDYITSKLKFVTTKVQNQYVLQGTVNVLQAVAGKELTVARLPNHSIFQYLTRCVRYNDCNRLGSDKFSNYKILNVAIRGCDVVVDLEWEILNINNCLEFNTILRLA